MIRTKAEIVEKEVIKPVSYQCDKCKKDFDIEEYDEIQEFHHIRFTGGYGSIFGDGTGVECDLCQKCLHAMIKDYMKTKAVW